MFYENDQSEFVHTFSKTISGCFTPAEAEALALRETLIWLLHLQK